ncbi:Divergent AAA domain protein [compost metagenome]
MNYSQVFFYKDLYDINENDVIDFFQNSPEESSILELKSGETKIESIYQEVCALHNMEGGMLIIGAPRPRKADGKEYFDGELTRSSFKNKDWVYQKISSNISPAPSGLRIHDIKMSDGKYIQIIDIPKSSHPPHQCLNNGIYYLRFESESRFAPQHQKS